MNKSSERRCEQGILNIESSGNTKIVHSFVKPVKATNHNHRLHYFRLGDGNQLQFLVTLPKNHDIETKFKILMLTKSQYHWRTNHENTKLRIQARTAGFEVQY